MEQDAITFLLVSYEIIFLMNYDTSLSLQSDIRAVVLKLGVSRPLGDPQGGFCVHGPEYACAGVRNKILALSGFSLLLYFVLRGLPLFLIRKGGPRSKQR